MLQEWVASSWGEVSMVLLSAVVTYSVIIIYVRITGLRSFSKMSAADFAMTIAVGSVFASTISSPSPTLLVGLTALAALFTAQWFIAILRERFQWFSKVVDNEPLLLMSGDRILDRNLQRANLTRADLFGKLREANAFNYSEVHAVVFEATGDISVLHAADSSTRLEPDFFQNVIGADQLFDQDWKSE